MDVISSNCAPTLLKACYGGIDFDVDYIASPQIEYRGKNEQGIEPAAKTGGAP
ncbi:MAG: hypothetical protein V7604_566 [Hyphomicrobiales bacterium]|jgi:hypothetical protein